MLRKPESESGESGGPGLFSLSFARYPGEGAAIGGKRTAKDVVFTIGHSNHSAEKFIRLLQGCGVEILIDTRSHPYSRHAPRFNARTLEAALARNDIGYLFLGAELGGRPEGRKFYDAKGRVDYGLVGCSGPFLDGISRLEGEVLTHMAALLCSEEDPARCHRRLLVGRVLEERGFSLRHIRGDGSIQREGETDSGQPVLFPEMETSPRKSIRSVSRRRRPPSSSER
jgi:uncharacterized protein (DUF488 family)